MMRPFSMQIRLATMIVLALVASLLAAGCKSPTSPTGGVPQGTKPDQGLLTAYKLLKDTLHEEARLDSLHFLREITFQSPIPEVEDFMSRLSTTSELRLEELEELQSLAPDVSSEPEFMDPIGKSITSNATKAGTREMIDLGGRFNIRFIFLQAQATRMVNAIATAASEVEPNPTRRRWLTDLAAEYEEYRDELVDIVEDYVSKKER